MTVKELIVILSKLPETHNVVVACDSEGNNFRPLSDEIGDGTWSTAEREFYWFGDEDDGEKADTIALFPED